MKLIIPEKISLQKELAPGIGWKELKQLLVIALPGVILGVTVWFSASGHPLTQLIALVCTIIYLPFCYSLVARFDGAPSLLTHVSLQVQFHRQQQKFYYKQEKEALYYVAETGRPDADSTGAY